MRGLELRRDATPGEQRAAVRAAGSAVWARQARAQSDVPERSDGQKARAEPDARGPLAEPDVQVAPAEPDVGPEVQSDVRLPAESDARPQVGWDVRLLVGRVAWAVQAARLWALPSALALTEPVSAFLPDRLLFPFPFQPGP